MESKIIIINLIINHLRLNQRNILMFININFVFNKLSNLSINKYDKLLLVY